jgi:endonuclease/exonuclease/phosphatase (EEP) superfamily protein YafD
MRSLILAALAAALVLAVVAQQLLHAQTGPLPLAGVFELYLLLAAGVLAVGAIVGSLGAGRAAAWTRLVALAVVVVVVVRAGGEVWSGAAAPPAGDAFTVLSWNLEMDSKTGAEVVGGILQEDADVVSIQELTPMYGTAIEADATLKARYPYRILSPEPGAFGAGILSKLPLIKRDSPFPTILQAGLLLRDGRTVELLDVHARRPLYRTVGPVPIALDTVDRDHDIRVIADAVAALQDPRSALVAGDLNGTWTEPGLEPLRALVADAHEVAGTGLGFTWRPERLEFMGVGTLRIDHVLTGALLRPVDTSLDCSVTGDHCRFLVRLAVEPATKPPS